MNSRTPTSLLLGATLMVLTASAATGLAAQGPPNARADEQAVRATNDRLQAAVLASDTAAFTQLLAPEYLFITATGAVMKRRRAARIRGQTTCLHPLPCRLRARAAVRRCGRGHGAARKGGPGCRRPSGGHGFERAISVHPRLHPPGRALAGRVDARKCARFLRERRLTSA